MPSSISERLEKQKSTINDNDNKIVDNNNKIDSLNYLAGFYKLLQDSIDNGLRVSRSLARIEPINDNGKVDDETRDARPISDTTSKYQNDLQEGRPNMLIPHISIFHMKNGRKIEK